MLISLVLVMLKTNGLHLSRELKCNIDASIFSRTLSEGYRSVLRNILECFLATKDGVLLRLILALIAEVLSFFETLSWLKDKRLKDILLGSDTTSCLGIRCRGSIFGLIVSDGKFLFKKSCN